MSGYKKFAKVFTVLCAALLAVVVLAGCKGGLGWDDRMPNSPVGQNQFDSAPS